MNIESRERDRDTFNSLDDDKMDVVWCVWVGKTLNNNSDNFRRLSLSLCTEKVKILGAGHRNQARLGVPRRMKDALAEVDFVDMDLILSGLFVPIGGLRQHLVADGHGHEHWDKQESKPSNTYLDGTHIVLLDDVRIHLVMEFPLVVAVDQLEDVVGAGEDVTAKGKGDRKTDDKTTSMIIIKTRHTYHYC